MIPGPNNRCMIGPLADTRRRHAPVVVVMARVSSSRSASRISRLSSAAQGIDTPETGPATAEP